MSVPVAQLKTAEDIRDDIIAEIASQTGITDENLGSVVRSIAYAVGLELDEFYYQLYRATRGTYIKTATGDALDDRASDFSLTRYTSTKAVGVARFTCSGAATIPIGTQVAASATTARDEIVFVTTAVATIVAAGTVDARIEAVVSGADGNLSASTITTLKDSVTNVTAVTNPSASVLGRDQESDAELRERILRTLEGLSRGTPPSIIHGAVDFEIQQATLANALPLAQTYIEVEEDLNLLPFSEQGTRYLGIDSNTEVVVYTGIDVSVTPHRFTGLTRAQKGTIAADHEAGVIAKEYIDDGDGYRVTSAELIESPVFGRVDVYIDDSTSTGVSTELVDLVEKRLQGDGTDRDPGYRGAGILLYVTAASIQTIAVTASIVNDPDYDWNATKTAVESAVVDFINGHNVGQDVYGYQVAEAIMAVEGVLTVISLVIAGTTFVGTPSADVLISNTTVARTDTGNVTIS